VLPFGVYKVYSEYFKKRLFMPYTDMFKEEEKTPEKVM